MVSPTAPLREKNETNISAEQPPPEKDPRVPRQDGHSGGAPGAQAPTRQGSQAAHCRNSTEAAQLSERQPDQRYPKSKRIRQRGEFVRIQGRGRPLSRGNFVVIAAPPATGASRLGITASRKVGNAVVRNRIKRLIREFFRRHYYQIHPPRDFVVIARASASQASYDQVASELGAALLPPNQP